MEAEDKLKKFEDTLRRILREELEVMLERVGSVGKKTKVGFEFGRFTGISEDQMHALKAAYGSLDLDVEIKRAAAWIVSNPMMAPKSQHGRFLNAWLSKAQNASSLRSIPTAPRPAEHKQKHCEYCPRIATGSVGGLWHCPDHINDAMDRRPRAHMLGVVAKPVAGNDA